MRKTAMLIGTLALVANFVVPAQAEAQETRWGVGFQSSFPAYGLSGLYDMSERITLQAVLGALGTVTTFSGRGLYRFQTEEKFDLYGFGTVGMWRWSSRFVDETSLGIGGGAGIELDWRSIIGDSGVPPLFSSVDVGLTLASFDTYNFNALTIGVGLHYRF